MTPSGIEPATRQFVAQCLNHYATARPTLHFPSINFTSLLVPSLQFTPLHFISIHFTSIPFTSHHFTSHHFTSPHITSLHFTTHHSHRIMNVVNRSLQCSFRHPQSTQSSRISLLNKARNNVGTNSPLIYAKELIRSHNKIWVQQMTPFFYYKA